jgi:hypothetical protein
MDRDILLIIKFLLISLIASKEDYIPTNLLQFSQQQQINVSHPITSQGHMFATIKQKINHGQFQRNAISPNPM